MIEQTGVEPITPPTRSFGTPDSGSSSLLSPTRVARSGTAVVSSRPRDNDYHGRGKARAREACR
jgi:hypothetical protein